MITCNGTPQVAVETEEQYVDVLNADGDLVKRVLMGSEEESKYWKVEMEGVDQHVVTINFLTPIEYYAYCSRFQVRALTS